uniref:Uncharacterized protein n=1 Tax=Trypanosoma vivax (strain Y486) TaxID=1055687 RepID=G0TSC7_TRYVY|nr:conserved hypothetical protein [Trypanosoma vivax Y486]
MSARPPLHKTKTSASKTYPPPDLSKTYTDIPHRQLPRKSPLKLFLTRVGISLGFNIMEPGEKLAAAVIYTISLLVCVWLVCSCFRLLQSLVG